MKNGATYLKNGVATFLYIEMPLEHSRDHSACEFGHFLKYHKLLLNVFTLVKNFKNTKTQKSRSEMIFYSGQEFPPISVTWCQNHSFKKSIVLIGRSRMTNLRMTHQL